MSTPDQRARRHGARLARLAEFQADADRMAAEAQQRDALERIEQQREIDESQSPEACHAR